jgi:Leucine-rich repeat (LRR) protein
MSRTIQSLTGVVHIICPTCGTNTIGDEKNCSTCGRELPFAFVIPYGAKWDYEPALVKILQDHQSLRIMGKYSGKDPDKLSCLSHVTYLYLSRYPLKTKFLKAFDTLNVLELDYLKVDSFEGIANRRNLESLSLVECDVPEGIALLRSCQKLRVLNLALSKIKSYEGLQHLVSLIYLRFEGDTLASLNVLGELQNLKTLIINSKVHDKSLKPIYNKPLSKLLVKRGNFSKEEVEAFKEAQPKCKVILS